MAWWARSAAQGPSPRVRGADQPRPEGTGRRGTIPAGAGSRPGCGGTRSAPRDHPRGCGEQAGTGYLLGLVPGPSPRVRGAERVGHRDHSPSGTIPAGAGSSGSGAYTSAFSRDHPRGCGEQLLSSHSLAMRVGPSPRVRGAAGRGAAPHGAGGTIPAGAGSSTGCRGGRRRGGDHPRGCGEQHGGRTTDLWDAGPSPRVRGAALVIAPFGCTAGTIPAGAGSSRPGWRRLPMPGDHPRGCGEQEGTMRSPLGSLGPSPRVRGAEVVGDLFIPGHGTIPAGAGSSTCWRPPRSAGWDHPRRCGEQAAFYLPAGSVQSTFSISGIPNISVHLF